jgi:hypothetical protein
MFLYFKCDSVDMDLEDCFECCLYFNKTQCFNCKYDSYNDINNFLINSYDR